MPICIPTCWRRVIGCFHVNCQKGRTQRLSTGYLADVIELKSIRKAYQTGNQSLTVLKGIDCTIEEGELVAIMGSSGSGNRPAKRLGTVG